MGRHWHIARRSDVKNGILEILWVASAFSRMEQLDIVARLARMP